MNEVSNGKVSSSGRGVVSKNSGGTYDLMLLVIGEPNTIRSFRLNNSGEVSSFFSFRGDKV